MLESLWTLEMDLEPFNSHFPIMTRPSSIGDGVRFLNRRAHLAGLCNVICVRCMCHCFAKRGTFGDALLASRISLSQYQPCIIALEGHGALLRRVSHLKGSNFLCCGPRGTCWPCSLAPGEVHASPVVVPASHTTSGVAACCRQLSSLLFSTKADFHPLFDFLSGLAHEGRSLMLNGERIADFEAMGAALDAAEQLLASKDDEARGGPFVHVILDIGPSLLLACSVHMGAGIPCWGILCQHAGVCEQPKSPEHTHMEASF